MGESRSMMSSPSRLQHASALCLAIWYHGTYDARATSRPEGEMVADPTPRVIRKVTSSSKVGLSKADLIVFDFFSSSIRQ